MVGAYGASAVHPVTRGACLHQRLSIASQAQALFHPAATGQNNTLGKLSSKGLILTSKTSPWPERPVLSAPDGPEHEVAELVGQVYAQAPEAERERLLVALLPTAGLLSLVAVANGVFARIRLDEHWPSLRWLHEEMVRVQPADVSALVERLQFTRSDALDGLLLWAGTAPVLASGAAATLLVGLLMQRRLPCGDDGRDLPA